jgi:hypothetical protein
MTLAPAQEAILALPFALNEHAFNGSNNVYIKKSAIRRRLSLVDPGWSQTPPVVVTQDDNTVALAATLTICGSTRSGVGVGVISRWNKDKTPMKDFGLALAVLKAQKNADTDLLPRCAIQFNVGAYLKAEGVKDIKTEDALKEFLAKLPAPPSTHWAANGGRERIGAIMKKIGMEWKAVADLIEPGRTLSGLSETTLDEAMFTVRLAEIALKPAAPVTPPPAPPTPTQPPRYGESSATTSTPVAPAVTGAASEAPINLDGFFPESTKLTSPPADKLNDVYKNNPNGFRNTVRHVGSSSGKPETITWFRIHPKAIEAKDIYRDGNGPIALVKEVLDSGTAGVCAFKVLEQEERGGSKTDRVVRIDSALRMLTIVGGPKLERVQRNPALAPPGAAGRVWAGEQKARAS